MQKALPYIILILLCEISFSCKEETSLPAEDAVVPMESVNIPDSLRQLKVLDRLVDEITKLERLEGKYIGFAGQPSSQRDYSHDLLILADTKYLLKLTSHNNPIVRIISFKVLNTKGYSDIKNVFKEHIQDNETFNLYSACLITTEPVNLNMYNTIENQLSDTEKKDFLKLIKKQLRKSKYRYNFLLEKSL